MISCNLTSLGLTITLSVLRMKKLVKVSFYRPLKLSLVKVSKLNSMTSGLMSSKCNINNYNLLKRGDHQGKSLLRKSDKKPLRIWKDNNNKNKNSK